MAGPLLEVAQLTTVFRTGRGEQAAIEDVSFDVAAGEVLGIVGESGSGKSVTALSIMGLLPDRQGRVSGGRIDFEGRPLLAMTGRERRALRGRAMGMIFQEPMTSLNPVFTVGDQVVEAIRAHAPTPLSAARDRAVEMLARVGIPSPARRMNDYPHRLSGGMRQRVVIAIALAGAPRLLLADEPTTALDVTIQAQLLDLLRDLQRERGMGVVLITHNMGVIAEVADRVLVMYAGRVVEAAPVEALFDAPRHPYTRGLIGATPVLEGESDALVTIPGALPPMGANLPGCRFAPRCPRATDACRAATPPMLEVGAGHHVACLHHDSPSPDEPLPPRRPA